MCHIPRLLMATIISTIAFSSSASAQGVFLEGDVGVRRTNAENFDVRYSEAKTQALQRVKLNSLTYPLLFGLRGEYTKREVADDPTESLETIESERVVVNGIFGFIVGEGENSKFRLIQLFAASFQESEAFGEKFYLGGAWLRTNMRFDIYSERSFENHLEIDIQAAGRLGTDSAHASGTTRARWELSFTRPFLIKLGLDATARFEIENLGINSGLEKFNLLVDVELTGLGFYAQVWIFNIDLRYSPPFLGRLTTQSHLGVQNNGPAEHLTLKLGVVFDF